MLTKVEVVTLQGTTLSLPLDDTSAGFVVQDITGLDPVKSTIVRSKFAQIDGTKRQSSSREDRNIVLTVGFAPDYATTDIRALRNYLYQYLMPKSAVLLKFYMDGVLFVQVQAEVESCEAPLFAKDPQVAISLIAFDPDFSAPNSVVVEDNTVSTTTERSVPYAGSSPVGFKFRLLANRALTTFTIYNRTASGVIYSLEYVGDLVSGDVLEIDTLNGAKGAWLTHASAISSVLYGVSPVSTWVNFFPGTNHIRVAAAGAAVPYTVEYLAKYGGL